MLSASSPPISPAVGSMARGMAARTSSTTARCPASMRAMNSSSVPARGASPAPSQYASSTAGLRVISRPYRVISAHVCGCTQCTQVPPSSRSWPSLRSVQVRPPTRSRASSTITSSPARPSSRAATSPANPAPMTTTSARARPLRRRLASVVSAGMRLTSVIIVASTHAACRADQRPSRARYPLMRRPAVMRRAPRVGRHASTGVRHGRRVTTCSWAPVA